MVFGDCLNKGVFEAAGASRDLVSDAKAYGEVLALAEQIGVEIVLGSLPGAPARPLSA